MINRRNLLIRGALLTSLSFNILNTGNTKKAEYFPNKKYIFAEKDFLYLLNLLKEIKFPSNSQILFSTK